MFLKHDHHGIIDRYVVLKQEFCKNCLPGGQWGKGEGSLKVLLISSDLLSFTDESIADLEEDVFKQFPMVESLKQ